MELKMIKRLFFILQLLATLLPIVVFVTYIVAAEGDQWSEIHFLATALFSIPLVVLILLKYIIFGKSI